MNSETIETRIHDMVEAFIKDEYLTIGGKVYYRGSRPIGKNQSSYAEDAVVAFLTGTSGDIQKGTCLVNVYTNDIKAPSGMYYKDKTRCEEIAAALDIPVGTVKSRLHNAREMLVGLLPEHGKEKS